MASYHKLCPQYLCAWNRDLNIVPERLSFSKRLTWISNPDTAKRSKIYYFLCMLNYMLQTTNPTLPFKSRLKMLLKEYEGIVLLNSMGFPADWEKEKIWESVK